MLKIGVFDSGLGGLTIVQDIRKLIKGAKLFYIADTLHAPYGEKTSQQILAYSLEITHYLVDTYAIDVLVIACNTATSAAVERIRLHFPSLLIIGTEPAIKPAIQLSKSGKVGVLATPATLKGYKYQQLRQELLKKYGGDVYEQACPGLVEYIENDALESKESIAHMQSWLSPMKEAGVDTIVLGCTHYPLASKVIHEIMHTPITLVDSGAAIAKYLLQRLEEIGHVNSGILEIELFSTGDINQVLVHQILSKDKKMTHISI